MVPSGFITSTLPVIRTTLAVGREWDLWWIVSRELVIYAKALIPFCMVSWPIPWSQRWKHKNARWTFSLILIFKTHCASISLCWQKSLPVLFYTVVSLTRCVCGATKRGRIAWNLESSTPIWQILCRQGMCGCRVFEIECGIILFYTKASLTILRARSFVVQRVLLDNSVWITQQIIFFHNCSFLKDEKRWK